MKTIMQKVLFALLMLGTYTVHAQTSIHKFTNRSIKNLGKKVKTDCPQEYNENGNGYRAYLPALGKFPKKVALISFFTIDPGNRNKAFDPTVYPFPAEHAEAAEVTIFSNAFYKEGVDALVASFKERGIDLLLPEQYLDTEGKKEYYNDFSLVAQDTSEKIFYGLPSGLGKATVMPADGFRSMNIGDVPYFHKGKPWHHEYMYSFKDLKTLKIYGYDLCQKLGVEAVLIVHNLTTVPIKAQDKFVLNYVGMHLIGLNPIQKRDGEMYSKGVFYEGMRMRTGGGKGLLISADSVDNSSVAGYDKIIQAISNKMLGSMKEAMDSGG